MPEIKTKAEKSKRLDIIHKYWEFCETHPRQLDFLKRKVIANDFYHSRQWDAADVEELDKQGRPHETINLIKPIIRSASGYQRQSRQATTVLARKGGKEFVADVLSQVARYFEDLSHNRWQEAIWFFYGLINIKSWLSFNIDYTLDPISGDLIMRVEDESMIIEDPQSKAYDLNEDCRFIFKNSWQTKEWIEMMFPGVELPKTGDDYLTSDIELKYQEDHKDEYLIRECQWKNYVKENWLIELATQERRIVDDKTAAEARKNKRKYRIIPRIIQKLNLTTYLGSEILQDYADPFNGVTKYSLIRFVPDFVKGECRGEVEDQIGVQKITNKSYSQILHHLNTSANSGHWVEEGSLTGRGEVTSKEELEQSGSKSGFVGIYAKGTTPPIKITPTSISQGHIWLAQSGHEIIKRISGINDATATISPERNKNLSGIAMQQQTAQGLIANEIVFDNFRFSKQIASETLVDFLRMTDVVTVDEMIAICDDKTIAAWGEKYKLTAEQMLLEIQDRNNGRYGIQVDQQQSLPTIMKDHFAILLQAAEKFPGAIPPDLLIEYSQLPPDAKERIRKQVEETKQMQLQQQQQIIAGGNEQQIPVQPQP